MPLIQSDDVMPPTDCAITADPSAPAGHPKWDTPRGVEVRFCWGGTEEIDGVDLITQMGSLVQFFGAGCDIPRLIVPHHNLASISIQEPRPT